tara:strand:- start:64 stop:621 length:558 start_codon:yes stop_codon:yes gene_type:complete
MNNINSKSKSKINTKSKKNSLYFYNKNNKTKKYIDNKEYTRNEFNSSFVGKKQLKRRFKKLKNCNLFIMFDPDAPNGEGNLNNKVFIHYLKIINNNKNNLYFSYEPPTPPKGTHNYYALSIKLDDSKIIDLIDLLKSIKNNNRTNQLFQGLKVFISDGKIKDFNLDNVSVSVNEIKFHNHFKVKN